MDHGAGRRDARGGLALEGEHDDALAPDEVARRLMATLVTEPGVRRVGLALTEGGGRRLRFTASDRDHAAEVDWCHIDAYDDVPLTTVVRTSEPVLGALDDLDPRYHGLVDKLRAQGYAAMAAVPLPGTGSPMGGLALFYDAPQAFDDDQRATLAAWAEEVGAVLRRGRAVAPRRREDPADEAVGEDAVVAGTTVDGDVRAAGEARRFLRRQLTAWSVDDDVSDTAVLCLSELVTNAVIHTGTSSEVRAVLDRDVLTVTVRDQGAPTLRASEPADDDLDPLRVHGRGLQLVEALSQRWGSDRDAVGTTVWFALGTDGSDGPDGIDGSDGAAAEAS